MKRYFLRRMFGIVLAGVLTLENCVPALAAEQTYTATEEYAEEAESTIEEKNSQTKNAVEEPEEEQEAENHSTEAQATQEETTKETEETTEEETETESGTEEEKILRKSTKSLQKASTVSLTAPSDLTVTGITATGVTLQWNTVSGGTGYKIYRSTAKDSGYSCIATISTDSNRAAYMDTGCQAGQTYYYKVLAYAELSDDTLQEGPCSDIVNNAVTIEEIVLNKSELTMEKGSENILKVIFVPSYAADTSAVKWSSDNEEVVTVENGKVKALSIGEATVTATVGDKSAVCKVTVKQSLQEIVLDRTEVTLVKGKTETLTAGFVPETTTDSKQISWTSSDSSVVTIQSSDDDSKQAVIKAVGAGEAYITAQSGEKTVMCHVNVTIPATAINLSEKKLVLLENNDSVEVTISLLPVDTTDTELTWEVEDANYVDCELNGNVLAVKSKGVLGDTVLTIKAGSKEVKLPVEIVDEKEPEDTDAKIIPVNEIKIKADLIGDDADSGVKGTINLKMNDEKQATATLSVQVKPENATNTQVTWKSSNPKVVSVTQAGVVTATGIGRATVTATADNGVSDNVAVVVLSADQKFKITSSHAVTLYCNETLPEATGITNTHKIILSKELQYEYRSSNTEVVTVDDNGQVTAVAPGNAVITVLDKASGYYETMSVTVKKIAEDIKVAREEMTVVKGTKSEVFFDVVPQDVSKDCLATLYFKKGEKTSPITLDENWTKGKTSGSVKFTADSIGTATLIMTAGDTYTDEDGEKVKVTSVEKVITIHVVSDIETLASSVRLTGNPNMKSNTTQTLDILVKDSSGNDLDVSQLPIGYTSSDEKIATVDAAGKVTALKGGRAVITAYVMDGSNRRAAFAINVNQRPESISFDREVYGVTKAVNAAAAITLRPVFMPTTTAGGCRGVNWYISEVRNADGTKVEETAMADYFTVNASGTVTAKKPATDGMRAIVKCESKEYGADEQAVFGEAVVLVQPKKVSSVRFENANVQAVGLTEHELAFITTFTAGNTTADYVASSSDAKIAEVMSVEDGVVRIKAHKYGSVTITLCADNMVTTTCRVTIYPVEKGGIVAAQSSYLLQQAQYDGTDRAELVFVDSKTKKTKIAPTLFTYKSSNPDVVSVDKNGVAYANPKSNGKITSGNGQVTITATLKDDPDKRTATTKVIVCPTEQIESMAVTFYKSVDAANSDKNNTSGKTMTDNGTNFVYSASGQNIVLRVTSYGANSRMIQNPQLSFTSSDSNVALVKSQTRKTFGSGEDKYEVWEAVVTVKRAGRFAITVSAKDQKKYSRKIAFGAFSGEPILASDGLGTINTNADIVKVNKEDGIASDQTFTVLPADGTQIKNVSVASADMKIKKDGRVQTVRLMNAFKVEDLGDNRYRIIMEKKQLTNAVDGTYNLVLKVTRSTLQNEDTGFGGDEGETVTKAINTTYKIASSLPKIDTARITINSFIRGDEVKIPLNTKETIEQVSIAPGMNLANEIEILQKDDGWYAKIQDDKFDSWKKASTSGKLNIQLKGYATPVVVNLVVTLRETKPVVRQLAVPSIYLDNSNPENPKDSATTTLVDNMQNMWTDYSIICKNPDSMLKFKVERQQDNKTKITFVDAGMKLAGQGATYTEKVLVSKPEWRTPIELSVSARAYNTTSIPTVRFDKSTVYINRNIGETSAETGVIVSLDNVELTQGEWQILDTCRYRAVENGQAVLHQCSDAFRTTYENGKLKIELKNPETMPNGTYNLIMTRLWDASKDEGLKQPLRTAGLTVVVRNVAPVVTIRMSGSLDLVKRTQSTLQGTVTVSNVNSTISNIKLVNTGKDGFANKFYCVRKDNTFKIYARSNVALKTVQTKGNVEITMSDGTVLLKEIAFTPVQSTPKVITPDMQKIYKSASTQTVNYNFNKDLEKGVHISKITASDVPEGIKVQDSNGHLFVTLADKTLKAGKYRINVNVYFKGEQADNGNELGRPVVRTIYVEVRE